MDNNNEFEIYHNFPNIISNRQERKELSYANDNPAYKEDYQIAISQDGKFAVTFDTANLRIRILENTDRRSKKKNYIAATSDEINKAVAYFKINNCLSIDNLYETDHNPQSFNGPVIISCTDYKFRWSLDISYLQHVNRDEYSIFVAVSHIDINKDMKGKKDCSKTKSMNYRKEKLEKKEFSIKKTNNQEETTAHIKIDVSEADQVEGVPTKGTAIYCLKVKEKEESYDLSNVTFYYSDSVAGICKFVKKDSDEHINEDLDPSRNNDEQDKSILKRFIVLNIHGIYNYDYNDGFNFGEKFDYPKSIEDELEYCHKEKDCMDKLLTCLYNQYFLVEQCKNNVQALEVYCLAEMEIKTTARRVERKDKHIRKYNRNTFSISKLQLCFTRGLKSIKLYLMENGLETVSKKLDMVQKIHLLEFVDNDEKLLIMGEDEDNKKELKFIIWDLHKTEKVKVITLDDFLTIKDLTTRLARTSGNLLKVDDKGKVTSVLQKIEIELQSNEECDLKQYKESKKLYENHHNIYFDESTPNFKPIVDEKEPWVMDDYENYERNSYCLKATEAETLQLIVGRSTVQIWHQIHQIHSKKKDKLPNKGEPFLEYIWVNDIPVDQERKETRLRIEEMKYGLNDFCLKVSWYERDLLSNKKIKEVIKDNKENEMEKIINDENKEIERMVQNKDTNGNGIVKREKTIRWEYINEKVKAVIHACEALKHLNKRRKFLGNNYIKLHKCDEKITYIQHIIWTFVKNRPDQFRLLDVRYNVMKDLILGDCNHLIMYILFGDEENENKNGHKENGKIKKEEHKINKIRHIPISITWSGKKFVQCDDLDYFNRHKLEDDDDVPENNMELVIYHCRDRELKDTIIVAYLLEYYSSHATDHAGWMCTVSKALPLLFKYNYDEYARKLFRKECFADQNHFSAQDPYEIIPEKYLARRNRDNKFLAFKPIVELKSDRYGPYDRILEHLNKVYEFIINFKHKMYDFFKGIDEDLGMPPLALRVVPLPEFTRHKIKRDKVEYGVIKIIINIIWFVFLPRTYKIGQKQKNQLSPFSKIVRYENNDDIYDNPATEAVIDFRWGKTRNFFFFLFLRFLIFAFSFGVLGWAYLNHEVMSDGFRNTLVVLVILFYYLAAYVLINEFIQFKYYGSRKYFDIYNVFDICSIVLPVVVMSIMLQHFQFADGFKSMGEVDPSLVIGISFTLLIFWIEAILQLRLISYIATYLYYFIIIIKTIFPFILFMGIVVIALASPMFVLLDDPKNANIPIKSNTFSGNDSSNGTITLQADFNPTDRNDNPFSLLSTSIIAAYYWLSGNMVQRDHFDFWVIDLFSLIASIFLATILLNMLIAFMSGVYEEAATKGRQALLRYRAKKIAEYEALHHIHFWDHEPDPKYIYYIGQSNNFEQWYKNIKKNDEGAIYKDFEEKCTFIKYTFEESDYDEYSIWKYEELN